MRYIMGIFLLFISFSLIAQDGKLNQKDASGNKQGYWVYYYDDSQTQKKEEGSYSDNKKTGIWKKYYKNGKLKHKITFKNNRADGPAEFYYENGNLSEKGIWKINKWVGEYKYYHKNGNPSYEFSYNEKGKRTGEQKYYHENGKLMIEGTWKNGKESGVIKEYDENGNIKSEKYFAEGKLDPASVKKYNKEDVNVDNNGDDTKNEGNINDKSNGSSDTKTNNEPDKNLDFFDGNGEHSLYKQVNGKKLISKKGMFSDGKLETGKHFIYNAEGELVRTAIYQKGELVDVVYSK